jgi:hypothetical protein
VEERSKIVRENWNLCTKPGFDFDCRLSQLCSGNLQQCS